MTHSNSPSFQIKEVRWQSAAPALREIRTTVFIIEQHVPEALEWDGEDDAAWHLLAITSEGESIGCARILPSGVIGRMAVLPAWRNKGVGRQLLQAAISLCRKHGQNLCKLSAQVHAIPFYQKAGFEICGPEYLDAGIQHRDMQLAIPRR
jgi:predicted GNAT family N-acyltransferase